MSMLSKDRALIVDTFETINASIDWHAVRAALSRIGRDVDTFKEVRAEIWARGTHRYITQLVSTRSKSVVAEHKAQAMALKDFTIERAHIVIQMTNASATKPNAHGKRSELEEMAFKSGRNAWDYIVKTSGYVTQETRGGARKPRTPDTKSKATTTPVASDVPMTLPSILPPKANGVNDMLGFYLSMKQFLIRVQANNAQHYTGNRGSALLAAHNAYVKAIAEAEQIKD